MNPIREQPAREDCMAYRRDLLDRASGPHVVSTQTQAVHAHLQDCPACRAYADEMLAWRRLGGRLRQHGTAPSAVRQRIFRELALARTQWLRAGASNRGAGSWGRWPWGIALLAAVALLTIVGLWQGSREPPSVTPDTASAVAEDHWRDLHRQHIDSTDPAEVQHWLASRLAIPVQVMALQGAVLQGARLCFLRGKLGAVLHYRVGDASVSYYVMPGDARADAVNRDRRAIEQESAQGYNVALWQERGMLHALVGGLPRSRLLKLAATCHPVKQMPKA